MVKKRASELKIKGDRVRYFRKLRGLSQTKLAEGICTQATISLVEKRNKVPSMKILVRLVQRLDIKLEDVVVEPENRLQLQLNEGMEAVRRRDPQRALQAVASIKEERLPNVDDKKRYFFIRGMVEMTGNHDQEEAVYFFNRVLQLFTGKETDVYAIMSLLGLSLAYADLNNLPRTQMYVDEAMKLLQNVDRQGDTFINSELLIRWYVCSALFRLGQYRETLKRVDKAIALAVTKERLYLLDEFYALRARCLARLESADSTASAAAYTVAISLASVNQNHALAESLQQESIA